MTGVSKRASPPRKAATKPPAKARRATPRASAAEEAPLAAQLIDERIRALGGWRGETLSRVRALILAADPEATEACKWRGTPVWSHDGILCTGEAYTKVVKLTFARGASLPDPTGLFNSSLEGHTRRAIDLPEGAMMDAAAFQALVRAAVERNAPAAKAPRVATKARPVKLLSGGNPQIAKADGDAPVQAWLDALPDWKRERGRWLDALIVRTVPGVRKAVKWNSPFYGLEGQGWFLGLHTFTRYLKVAFFRGSSLRPLPPGTSKSAETRYLDLHEGDALDEARLATWVKQAAALPGWVP